MSADIDDFPIELKSFGLVRVDDFQTRWFRVGVLRYRGKWFTGHLDDRLSGSCTFDTHNSQHGTAGAELRYRARPDFHSFGDAPAIQESAEARAVVYQHQ